MKSIATASCCISTFLVITSSLAGDPASPPKPEPLVLIGTNQSLHSYISDSRGLPIWFSPEEVETRTWKTKDGKTMRLLSREAVKVGLPDLREIVVVRYGDPDSNRTVCIDFYATRQAVVPESYLLLCHDTHCPPLKTKVEFEKQGDRKFFMISGEALDEETLKRTGHKYNYELNNLWQMVEGFSHFVWEVH